VQVGLAHFWPRGHNKNMRREALVSNQVYHVLTRSIAGFRVFSSSSNCRRFVNTLLFYRQEPCGIRFSRFAESSVEIQKMYLADMKNRVSIVAYCLMPTHIHLILKQLAENGISLFMKNCLESFSKYFNTRYNRKGPLWESRFKSISVKTDDQLLHLTRYVHLNPVSAGIVEKPEDWDFSSYKKYLAVNKIKRPGDLCDWDGLLEIRPNDYKKFVEERINYQRQISKIKKQLLDGYSG